MPIKVAVNNQGLIDWLKITMGEKVENYLEWENGRARCKYLIKLWQVQRDARKIRHIKNLFTVLV